MYKSLEINKSYIFFCFEEKKVKQANICFKYIASIMEVNKKYTKNQQQNTSYLRNQRQKLKDRQDDKHRSLQMLINQQSKRDEYSDQLIATQLKEFENLTNENILTLIVNDYNDDSRTQFIYLLDIVQILYEIFNQEEQLLQNQWIDNISLDKDHFQMLHNIIDKQILTKKRLQSYIKTGVKIQNQQQQQLQEDNEQKQQNLKFDYDQLENDVKILQHEKETLERKNLQLIQNYEELKQKLQDINVLIMQKEIDLSNIENDICYLEAKSIQLQYQHKKIEIENSNNIKISQQQNDQSDENIKEKTNKTAQNQFFKNLSTNNFRNVISRVYNKFLGRNQKNQKEEQQQQNEL